MLGIYKAQVQVDISINGKDVTAEASITYELSLRLTEKGLDGVSITLPSQTLDLTWTEYNDETDQEEPKAHKFFYDKETMFLKTRVKFLEIEDMENHGFKPVGLDITKNRITIEVA